MVTLSWVAAFAVCLAIPVALRCLSAGRYDVKVADVTVAAVPVLIGLLVSGTLDDLRVGPEGFEVKRAFQKALSEPSSAAAVHSAKEDLPVEAVPAANKERGTPFGNVEQQVARLIKARVPALTVTMGKGHTGPAIQTYLEGLASQPFFRFLIINDADSKFLGLIPAESIPTGLSQGQPMNEGMKSFANDLSNALNTFDKAAIEKLPGFTATAIEAGTDKRSALRKLDEMNAAYLPVIQDGKFIGVADRARLVASVLVDISDQIGASTAKGASAAR